MAAPIVEVAKYLQTLGVGSFDETGVGGDIFIESLPAAPDEAIALYSTAGLQADGRNPYDYPGLQLIVRGTQNPMPARQRAQEIYDLLHGFHGKSFITDGTWVVNCLGTQSGPVHIGQDANRRHEYSLNFQMHILNDNAGRR